MDGNIQHLRPAIPSDREGGGGDQIETSFDTSGTITGNNSTDLVEREEIATIPDNRMAESLSTEWTDEKHRLYLSSMEASFVKQLYSREYRSMNMLDWSSRRRSKPDSNSSRQLNASSRPSSGQFKVLRGGRWKQISYGRPQTPLDIVDETHALPENQWIQRFRSGRRHREVTSSKMEENDSACTEAVHLEGNKTATTTVVATSSNQFSSCHSHLYHQESVGSSTEVSDQNFPNEDHKGEQLSSFSRAKRIKTTSIDDSSCVDDSNKDQVVPIGESSVMAVPPSKKCVSPGEGAGIPSNRKFEQMDGFGCLGSGSSYFLEQELHDGVYKAEEFKFVTKA